MAEKGELGKGEIEKAEIEKGEIGKGEMTTRLQMCQDRTGLTGGHIVNILTHNISSG